MIEPIRRVARHPLLRQQGKFLVVAAVATSVDFSIANVLAFIVELDKVVANVISFSFASVVNFPLNRFWVFDRRGRVDITREAAPFVLAAFVALLMSSGVVWLADEWFGGGVFIFNAAKIGGLGLILLAKFFVFRHWIFAERAVLETR